MISWLGFTFLQSAWGRYIILGLTLLTGVAVWDRRRKRAARRDVLVEIENDVRDRAREGIDAYRHTERVRPSDLAERVRGRDRHWRGM